MFPTMIPRDQGGYVTVSEEYPLGADKLGRDLLSRIIYGARISLAVARDRASFQHFHRLGGGLNRRICRWARG